MAPKGEKTVAGWIVACFADNRFTLIEYSPDTQPWCKYSDPRPYDELWDAMAELSECTRIRWLIGHRVRYALERADFLGALERGDVSLPQHRKKGNGKERQGKFCFSANCLEIDIVAGKNKLKLLDWRNYGFEPKEGIATLQPADHYDAARDLDNYLDMAKAFGLRVNKTTAPQIGWQHARIDHTPDVLMYNLDNDARDLERSAYFGGRNEPFRLGEIDEAVMSLDIKSCYGNICRACSLPTHMIKEYKNGLPVEDMQGDEHHHWVADVLIETPEADYPCRQDDTLLFPIGQFRTSLCWPELEHALKRGRVAQVYRAAWYRAEKVFRSYAEWYLNARELAAKAMNPEIAQALKAIFNGSLGFTARQKYTLMPWAMDFDKLWWIGYTSAPDGSAPLVHAQVLAGQKEWLKVAGEPREAMPFLHATITSWARLQLLKIMATAGRDFVYYCDTDGILVDFRGYANLLDAEGMVGPLPGQLVQRFPSGPCNIQGQKNYRIGDQVICAGMLRTSHSQWEAKKIVSTTTGHVQTDGSVRPFEFRYEKTPGKKRRWRNVFA